MEAIYELIKNNKGLPIKLFVHSVRNREMHFHKEIEIILVLEGSVNVIVDKKEYQLRENDLILLNVFEIHHTRQTHENNICLALQVDPKILDPIYPSFSKMRFSCRSFQHGSDEQERFDVIRRILAKAVWNINKKGDCYQYGIGSNLISLAEHLMKNFVYEILEKDSLNEFLSHNSRLSRIIQKINENIENGISLDMLAESEGLTSQYLSRYIKEHLGISFQQYWNLKRLNIAAGLLKETTKSITEIAYSSGFQSLKLFNTIFKKYYHCSPSQFRENYLLVGVNPDSIYSGSEGVKSRTYLDVDRNQVFKKLFTYLQHTEHKERDDQTFQKLEEKSTEVDYEIKIDFKEQGVILKPYWKKLIGFSRASEGLRSDWRQQLKDLQREIGFEYIRFHGIFNDEMMIVNLDKHNNVIYNWNYVDQLFDFYIEVNIKPFVELSFMPSYFKSSDHTNFWWKANVSQPREMGLWLDLVKSFVNHCIDRYGLEEVESWYFEVWNQPDLEYVFWIGNREEYFEFYKETAGAIKSISQNVKVGGPACTHQAVLEGTWFNNFISYCMDNSLPVDFVSLHIFPESFPSKGKMEEVSSLLKSGMDIDEIMNRVGSFSLIYNDENHTYDTLDKTNKAIAKSLPHKPEIHVTEWNASAYGRNLINDTMYVAAYIVRNVIRSIGRSDSLGYWTFTDIMEETKAGISPFHGGFGLINQNGIKKPSYFAYLFLSKLGSHIIEQGENYIVTKKGSNFQIMAWNFTYFDELFMSGDTSVLSYLDRYNIFKESSPLRMRIEATGLTGTYKLTKYQLDREHGSAFDKWLELGSPENMTKEEVEYLKKMSYPKMYTENVEIDEAYSLDILLPVHGVQLIILEKR